MPTTMPDLLENACLLLRPKTRSVTIYDAVGLYIKIGKKKPRARGARHRTNGAPGWGARKSAPVKMNTTRGELFLALKQNNPLKSGLRLTPGRPYSREGANQRPRRAASAQYHSQPSPNSQQAAQGQRRDAGRNGTWAGART